jgi:hypothetical protein
MYLPASACPDVPWQIFRQVVFSSISLAQVVFCVKNSEKSGHYLELKKINGGS